MTAILKNIPSELIHNNIIDANEEIFYGDLDGIMYNIGERYKIKGQLNILINKLNNKSSFGYGQVQLIKKYGGKFDARNEVWFLVL